MQGLASVLPWVQVALSVLLVAAILVQQNEAGLGAAFGGGDGGGPNFRKRGIEKVMFIATIVIAMRGGTWKPNPYGLGEVPKKGGIPTEGVIGTPRFINPVLATSDAGSA